MGFYASCNLCVLAPSVSVLSAKLDLAIIVILVVCGVAATIYTSPPQTKTPIKTTPTPMRDIAVGSDDDLVEDSDPEAETVETLEKLLSDSGVGQVEIPVRKTTLARTEEVGGRGREREEVDVRRI